MSDWKFAHYEPAEQLALLHHFAMKKGDVEFVITVKEYATPPDPAMKFFAEADKQTNQQTAAYTPTGWGPTLLVALSECIRAVRRFPYEG